MPQTCRVCFHAERERIDAALLLGTPVREVWEQIAQPLAAFSESSLWRHARRHVGGRSGLAGFSVAVARPADHLAALEADVELLEGIARDAAQRGAENVAIRATAEARSTRNSILDRLGSDAVDLAADLAAYAELFRQINASIRATPEASIAWAAALADAGRDIADDVRRTASAALTKKENSHE